MIKKSVWIFTTLIILLSVLYIFPWQNKIDKTLYGVQCRIGDLNYSEEVSIKIKGSYKEYLFKNDTFEGTIYIDKYAFTLDAPTMKVLMGDGFANLTYLKNGDYIHNLLSFGTLSCTPDFGKLLICISEPIEATSKSWHGDSGLFISAPAIDRKDAVEIAKSLSGKSKWLSHAIWN